ncbi:MAG TPA: hypothetical protein PKC43_06210 [Phycisphaerales bacterium]|nr:hypothetical protein [Phycisphaerales bacterium]HMP37025.1 hypothetical protein [Phycisphaerales bacterium]
MHSSPESVSSQVVGDALSFVVAGETPEHHGLVGVRARIPVPMIVDLRRHQQLSGHLGIAITGLHDGEVGAQPVSDYAFALIARPEADRDGDGVVDGADLGIVLDLASLSPDSPPPDVGAAVGDVLAHWGETGPRIARAWGVQAGGSPWMLHGTGRGRIAQTVTPTLWMDTDHLGRVVLAIDVAVTQRTQYQIFGSLRLPLPASAPESAPIT